MNLSLLRLILILFLILFAFENKNVYGDDMAYEKIAKVEGTDLSRYAIKTMEKGFFSERGIVGLPIKAESGDRIELWWTGIFPRYELYFFSRNYPEKAKTIGKCHFMGGCNTSYFLSHDENDNGIPDDFVFIVWESREGCSDDGSQMSGRYFSYTFFPEEERLFLRRGSDKD